MMSGESLCPHHIHQSEEKQEKPTDMPARRQFIIKLMSLGIHPQAPEGNVHEATAMPAMTPLL